MVETSLKHDPFSFSLYFVSILHASRFETLLPPQKILAKRNNILIKNAFYPFLARISTKRKFFGKLEYFILRNDWLLMNVCKPSLRWEHCRGYKEKLQFLSPREFPPDVNIYCNSKRVKAGRLGVMATNYETWILSTFTPASDLGSVLMCKNNEGEIVSNKHETWSIIHKAR